MFSPLRSWLTKALLALLGFAGINTAVSAEAPLPQFAFEEYLIAPLRVHLLTDKDRPALHTTLTKIDIERIVSKVNRVWEQAGIGFVVESVHSEAAAPAKPEEPITRSLRSFLSIIPQDSYGAEQFNIYYIKEFQVNGVYFPKAIFVQDTAALRAVPRGIDEPLPRVTAHELGHALGLQHRQDTTNLMASGTTGTSLNAGEVEIARRNAAAMTRFVRAPQLLEKANELFNAGKKSEAREIFYQMSELPLHETLRATLRERAKIAAAELNELPLAE